MNIDQIYSKRLSQQTATYLAVIIIIVASVTFLDLKARCSPIGITHAVHKGNIELIQACAKDGMLDAAVALGQLHAEGKLVAKDHKKAFGLCQNAALDGDINGMYCLGNFYAEAIGVEQNDIQAFHWFERAAGHNHEAATLKLAQCYLKGVGTTKNPQKAKVLFENLAKKGNAEAIKFIAKSVVEVGIAEASKDHLLQKDYENAFKICKITANEGNVDGMYCLGKLYTNGTGIEINNKQAFHWFERAAGHNHEAATLKLAQCYLDGVGTTKNPQKAKVLFENLAKKGNVEAIKALAEKYEPKY